MKTELIERINNYLNKSGSFHSQRADDKEIEQAEDLLNVIFDSDYKQFIKTFGGCYVGFDIYGFKNSNDLEEKTVVDLTKLYKEAGWPITEDCYVISFDSSGNPIMMDKSGEVILFDHDDGSFVVLANSFEELIEKNLPD
jgi:hypothetical protein